MDNCRSSFFFAHKSATKRKEKEKKRKEKNEQSKRRKFANIVLYG